MNKKGMSFIEIFVVVVIGVFFLAFVYMSWNRGWFFIDRGNQYIQMQRGARFFFEYLEDDVEQLAYFESDKMNERFELDASSPDELELVRYSHDIDEGRPELLKVRYQLSEGRVERLVFDSRGNLQETKRFGENIAGFTGEVYTLNLTTKTPGLRYFMRIWLRGSYQSRQASGQNPEQNLDVITSFSLKPVNAQFRDYHYLHNEYSLLTDDDKPL